MPTRLRKNRKLRGSRTVGYGQIGQHRKSGSRGGKGKAGLHKHKWSWAVKYAPDHFGKDKFKPPNRTIVKRWINVSQLNELYDELLRNNKIEKKDDKFLINLVDLDYDKLLGDGEAKHPYYVIVKSFTKSAKDKIEKVGGVLEVR
ncbi:MAG: uL15 family ribosomal protein [Nitrososphaerales archaeon]